MSGRVHIVYGDSYMAYRHSPEHPLQPVRVKLAVDQIQSAGLLRHAVMMPPRQATDAELALVHEPAYIALVRRLSQEDRDGVPMQAALAAGFGSGDNPIFPGMHEACAEIVGGSLVAAESVHGGQALHAFNPAGGLHHAMPARASGFCVYNDPAVAIAWLRARGHRVAYVDVDVHHGDGVEEIFYDDPDVLTVSLHESGRYLFPGTGFPHETGRGPGRGYAVNLPLQPFMWDGPWLAAFEAVVPTILRRFRPSILVTQDGCDTHLLDPLAHLQTSTAIWPVIGRRFHELAHELCDGRWVATGGGGYAVTEVVPRAWTLLFAEMVEHPELAVGLIDSEPFLPEAAAQQRVWTYLEKDTDELGRILDVNVSLPLEPAE